MPTLPADPTPAVIDDRAGRWAPWVVLAFVALWPLPGIAEGVLALGAIYAAVRMVTRRLQGQPRLLSPAAWALTSILFLGYWLPQALSALDAVDPSAAWTKTAAGLRYLPFMWLVAIAVATPRRRALTLGGLALITAAWTVDALVQALAGTSPWFWSLDQLKQLASQRPLCSPEEAALADRLSGALGPCNLKFGQVLASLSAFLLLPAATRFGRTGWMVATMAVGVVLLLAGSRASWITFALVVAYSGWRLFGGRQLLLLAVFGLVVAAGLAYSVPQLRDRVVRTAQAWEGNDDGVEQALSGRGRIWSAAGCMIQAHPINGVGARGFRDAYPDCDPAAGSTGVWGAGPALHAHQIVLEILAETGVIGLLLWLAAAAQAWRAWRFAPPAARDRARPAMLALAVTVFPLNTHLAFHSTFWGGVTVLLAALFAGSLLARDEPGSND
ncbi:membrane protein [Stenotrophomonas chelatiphaga]|uniref:Membrane protein n=1 Tax=Stenotrophomonas chelatiphaga TaxID=517011 RepID=A0A0R0DAL6_9GAMM|nr:O-antigen ligase family protein [Stenotrophomonas chelatiphaga]KRG74387.1 membrane protein [Stenotrophomonas chelatiphaga]ROQ45795.1 O-antigen ligase [Stenotrophomonas maltophilia]